MSDSPLAPAVSEIEEISGMDFLEMKEPIWKWHDLPPKQQPQLAWLIRDESGEAVSILRIFYRMLVCKERQLRAVGIGGVWVWPARRGQGYATALLDRVIPRLTETAPSADVVVLHAPQARELYSHLGFVEIAEGLYGTTIHPGESGARIDLDWKLSPEGHF